MPLVVSVTTYDESGHAVGQGWATRDEYGRMLACLPAGWRLGWV